MPMMARATVGEPKDALPHRRRRELGWQAKRRTLLKQSLAAVSHPQNVFRLHLGCIRSRLIVRPIDRRAVATRHQMAVGSRSTFARITELERRIAAPPRITRYSNGRGSDSGAHPLSPGVPLNAETLADLANANQFLILGGSPPLKCQNPSLETARFVTCSVGRDQRHEAQETQAPRRRNST